MRGPILAVIGAVLIVLAAVQHIFALIPVLHLSLYFAALGVIALAVGVWLSFRSGGAQAR